MASQITSLAIVYSIVYSDADQRKHQSSASLAFVRGNHRGPVNSPHKWPVTRKMFPSDDVIMALVASHSDRRLTLKALHQSAAAVFIYIFSADWGPITCKWYWNKTMTDIHVNDGSMETAYWQMCWQQLSWSGKFWYTVPGQKPRWLGFLCLFIISIPSDVVKKKAPY